MKTDEVAHNLYDTCNDIPENIRRQSVIVLNSTLATSLDLHSQMKQAHWNVKGIDFYQVQLMFAEIALVLSDPIDLIAERISTLGGVVKGTARDAANNSLLPVYPDTERMDEIDHLRAVADRLAIFCHQLQVAIEKTSSWSDKDSCKILTKVSREIDKQLWFVESHLQRMQS